jgi:pimeloyl-ACP methyl ester carboxylesterase
MARMDGAEPARPLTRALRRRTATWLLRLAVPLAWGVAPAAGQPAARGHVPPGAVVDTGRGPETYVLISGVVGGAAGLRRITGPLVARGHRVLAIDPYHLSIDSADVSFDALARRVQRVLAERGVGAARVVGHSHGGGVALRLAARAPEQVAMLVLIEAGAPSDHRSPVLSSTIRLVPFIMRMPGGRRFVRSRYLNGLRQNSASDAWLDDTTRRRYIEPVLDDIGRVAALAVRLGRAAEPAPVATVVARVRAPVTVLLATPPRPASPDQEELAPLAALGRQLRMEHIAGVGHFVHEEAPDTVLRYLLAGPAANPRSAPNR